MLLGCYLTYLAPGSLMYEVGKIITPTHMVVGRKKLRYMQKVFKTAPSGAPGWLSQLSIRLLDLRVQFKPHTGLHTGHGAYLKKN